MDWCVILFPSLSHAIYGQKVMKKEGIHSKLIPVPRLPSSNCGVCLRIADSTRIQSEKVLVENGIMFEQIVTGEAIH